MEFILFLIVVFFGNLILRGVLAAGKSAVTGKSFAESFSGFPEFGQRLVPDKLTDDSESSEIMAVQIRGVMPISRATNLGFMTSIFDVTDGDDWKPVMSYLDFMQEPDYNFFQQYIETGLCDPGSGYSDWVRVGGFFPEMLQPPRGGLRKLKVVIRLVNASDPPVTRGGFLNNKDGLLWSHHFDFEYNFKDKGYEEVAEHQEEAESIAVKIGVAVAFSDGSMDDAEGEVIKNWIKRTISGYSDSRQQELKNIYNNAFKSAYEEHQSGKLSISKLADRLNGIGERKAKFDAVDLAYEIMSADGVADPEEIKMIRNLGQSLDLDMEEIEQIRSSHMINLKDAFSQDDALEQLLGIDESWDLDKIKRHLASEFQKWNGRYNSLPEGDERENAQSMLNSIGKAREKYDPR